MSESKNFAVVDSNGVVVNVIVADQEFIDSLPDLVADPTLDTTNFNGAKFYDISNKNVSVGYTRNSNGSYSPKVPTEEEINAEQAASDLIAQIASDKARLIELRAKVGPGNPGLTQDERDELNVIMLTRS